MKFLKRPKLNNLLAIKSKDYISIKLSLHLVKTPYIQSENDQDLIIPTTPWHNIDFLSKSKFEVLIIAIDANNDEIYNKKVSTDDYGQIKIKLPKKFHDKEVLYLQFYEISFYKGISNLLGSIIPTKLDENFDIIISDFDKTLVETKYSSVREMYHSLNSPLNKFPNIDESIEILKSHISKGFTPFILSASPHFYEKPFRDWLYQNQIYTSNIFLKNFRKALSFFDNDLTRKDISNQGFYKLNQLIDILLMTGIPKKLVLIGDAFESDPLVYLLLRSILIEKFEPEIILKRIKNHKSFQIKRRQISQFLINLNQLSNLALNNKISMEIFIRARVKSDIESIKIPEYLQFIKDQKKHINFYITSSTTS